MRTKPPIFSRESLIQAIARYDEIGLTVLATLAISTGVMSGLGFVAQFDDPSVSTYFAGGVFGFGVWLIAYGFWHGAWLLPEYVERRLLPVYVVVAVLGFSAFGVVSYTGNQRFVAGEVSEGLADDDKINRLANAAQAIVSFAGLVGPVEAELNERANQAARFAEAEASGSGPTGIGGKGPVYFGFTASAAAYADARNLLAGRVTKLEQLRNALNGKIAGLRSAKADANLSNAERRKTLKTIEGEALALMREALALDPAGSVAAAAAIVGKGVPTPSLRSSSSAAKIAEINAGMAAFADNLMRQAEAMKDKAPDLPELTSQSQEEHLLANALRMPGLSLAALLFDACGWVIIGFRFAAYRSLRVRDERDDALDYDVYVTARDFRRVEDMTKRAKETQEKMLPPPKPRGRPRGSKNKTSEERKDA